MQVPIQQIKTHPVAKDFESYHLNIITALGDKHLSEKEFKDTFLC